MGLLVYFGVLFVINLSRGRMAGWIIINDRVSLRNIPREGVCMFSSRWI
jgi:hypothetical protein